MNKSSKYWFKRRRYGSGWVPTTYEGWLVATLYLVVVGIMVAAEATTPKAERSTTLFVTGILAVTLCLLCITIAKGPRPHWRWGKKPGDNPDEDF